MICSITSLIVFCLTLQNHFSSARNFDIMPYVMKSLGKVKLEDTRETEKIGWVLPWKNRSNNASAWWVLNYTHVLDYLDNTTIRVMAVLLTLFCSSGLQPASSIFLSHHSSSTSQPTVFSSHHSSSSLQHQPSEQGQFFGFQFTLFCLSLHCIH